MVCMFEGSAQEGGEGGYDCVWLWGVGGRVGKSYGPPWAGCGGWKGGSGERWVEG